MTFGRPILLGQLDAVRIRAACGGQRPALDYSLHSDDFVPVSLARVSTSVSFALPFRRRTTLSRDESVVFYPSFGYPISTDTWVVVIQGCMFDPRVTWLRRKPMLGLIRRFMRVDHLGEESFRHRMRQFLVNGAVGRKVTVRIGAHEAMIGPSDAAGLFRGEVAVPADELPVEAESTTPQVSWLTFQAVLPDEDNRVFRGRVQLVAPTGVSIISDVDDTLKHSNVPDRRDLFHNTFVRAFVAVPGMPELYRECAAAGAAFHYVSGSPWQLYEPLAGFWRDQGYPLGSFHLKRFRLRETARKIRTTSPQKAHKRAAIEPLLAAFPERRFILIGDAGEQDADIYAGLIRERPHQIAHMFIRSVRGKTIDAARVASACQNLSSDCWTLYEHAEEIAVPLREMVRSAVGEPVR